YYAQDDFENAARYYEQAVRADSFYVGAAYSAGVAYQRLGRMEDAIEMLEHAGRLAPDNREILEKLSEVRRIQSETP
ncbi:MAG: tetratricopeptide repeat protein, partial [bacterium]